MSNVILNLEILMKKLPVNRSQLRNWPRQIARRSKVTCNLWPTFHNTLRPLLSLVHTIVISIFRNYLTKMYNKRMYCRHFNPFCVGPRPLHVLMWYFFTLNLVILFRNEIFGILISVFVHRNPLAQMEEEKREHDLKMKKMESEMEQVCSLFFFKYNYLYELLITFIEFRRSRKVCLQRNHMPKIILAWF